MLEIILDMFVNISILIIYLENHIVKKRDYYKKVLAVYIKIFYIFLIFFVCKIYLNPIFNQFINLLRHLRATKKSIKNRKGHCATARMTWHASLSTFHIGRSAPRIPLAPRLSL